MSASTLTAHGAAVNAFGRHVHNLGRMGDLTAMILEMLHSEAWRRYRTATGTYRWLPGEFDYFLAVHDVDARDLPRLFLTPEKRAELAKAMDRTRVDDPHYRRSLDAAASANGTRHGLLEKWTTYHWAPGDPIGPRVRSRIKTGVTFEESARARREVRLRSNGSWTRIQAVIRAAANLSDDEIRAVVDALRDRLKPGRPVGTAPTTEAWRRVAEKLEWSPMKCAAHWNIQVDAAKKRLRRLRVG